MQPYGPPTRRLIDPGQQPAGPTSGPRPPPPSMGGASGRPGQGGGWGSPFSGFSWGGPPGAGSQHWIPQHAPAEQPLHPEGGQIAGGVGPKMGKSAGQGGSPEDWMALLQQFADEMNKPLDLNDPMVRNILEGARTGTMTGLQGQGVFGGYSNNQAEKSYIGAASGLQQQRRQLGLSALQSGAGASQDLLKTRYGMARDQYGDMMQNYQYGKDQNEGWGAGIGGAIGGVLGGIGGFATGGPAGAVGGFQAGSAAGSSFGRGIGGMHQPPPPTFSYKGYGGV